VRGEITDIEEAVASPQTLTRDSVMAHSLLDLVETLPARGWGRDGFETGEMWNPNSVISWLLTRYWFAMETIRLPDDGRAPGWKAGISYALPPQVIRTTGGIDP
jgi:hypothetical protein